MFVLPFYSKPNRPKFNRTDKEILSHWQGTQCGGCMTKLPLRNLTVDHIKPLEKGGSDRPSNLQLLCGTCNSMKGTGTQRQLIRKLEQQKLVKAQPKKSPRTAASKSTSSKGKKTPKGKEKNKDPIGALFESAANEESKVSNKSNGAVAGLYEQASKVKWL